MKNNKKIAAGLGAVAGAAVLAGVAFVGISPANAATAGARAIDATIVKVDQFGAAVPGAKFHIEATSTDGALTSCGILTSYATVADFRADFTVASNPATSDADRTAILAKLGAVATSVDVTVGADGKINVPILSQGCTGNAVTDFTVTEIEAPAGYTLDTTPQSKSATNLIGTKFSVATTLTFINQKAESVIPVVVPKAAQSVVKVAASHK